MTMRTFKSQDFKWKSNEGVSFLDDLKIHGFPLSGFYIKSALTGRMKLFLPNIETAENLDGQAYDYFSPGGNVTVRLYAEV